MVCRKITMVMKGGFDSSLNGTTHEKIKTSQGLPKIKIKNKISPSSKPAHLKKSVF